MHSDQTGIGRPALGLGYDSRAGDEPSFVVVSAELDERGWRFYDGSEGLHLQQVLLQGSDGALCDAPLGFSHEGWRIDSPAFDFVPEVAEHVVGAMIVTQLNPRAASGAMASKIMAGTATTFVCRKF
jgi:hypothetical protein